MRSRRKPVAKEVSDKPEEKVIITKDSNDDLRVEFINSGSISLNLALSQKGRDGGWGRGRIGNLVGDGSTGKTVCALEECFYALKEIKKKKSKIFPKVTKITIVYDNFEGVMDFPLVDMYGQKFVDSVEWIQSETCEQFGRNYQRRVMDLKKGEFLLYVADSIDSMITEAAKKRKLKSIKDDKEMESKAYAEKASFFSHEFFDSLATMMKGKDATLLLISQVRHNIGVTFGDGMYRTGGKALNFYTHQVCWLQMIKQLNKQWDGAKRPYAFNTKAKVKRNKLALPKREAEFPMLLNHGIDDVGSMVSFLLKDGFINIDGENRKADEVIDLASSEESEDWEKWYELLAIATEKRWALIEENTKVTRRKRSL